MLAYAKSVKGQHWLREMDTDPSLMDLHFQEFEAKAQYEGKVFRFESRRRQMIRVAIGDKRRYITPGDWDRLRAFVGSSQRIPLAPTLLSDAEALAANGHRRDAIVQAVAAMEISIAAFAKKPAADNKLWATLWLSAKEFISPKANRALGTHGNRQLPLSLIFSESDLSQSVVDGCASAITERQNVVHNGKKDIEVTAIREHLRNIRTLCEFLWDKSTTSGNATP